MNVPIASLPYLAVAYAWKEEWKLSEETEARALEEMKKLPGDCCCGVRGLGCSLCALFLAVGCLPFPVPRFLTL